MVTCQSANQLKTPAKVSWVFKMVSVWFTRRHNHGEDCWSNSCPEDNHWHPSQGAWDTNIHYQRSCSQSAVSKHVNRKLSGRKKMHNQPREPQLMRIVKQNRFKNLGELHKEWTEAGVKASRAPHTDVSRNLATVVFRGVLPGLRRRTGLLPSGPKLIQSPISWLACHHILICWEWIGGFLLNVSPKKSQLKEPKT